MSFGFTLRNCYQGTDLEPTWPLLLFLLTVLFLKQHFLQCWNLDKRFEPKHVCSTRWRTVDSKHPLFLFGPRPGIREASLYSIINLKNQKGGDTTKRVSQSSSAVTCVGLVRVFCQEYLWACNRVSASRNFPGAFLLHGKYIWAVVPVWKPFFSDRFYVFLLYLIPCGLKSNMWNWEYICVNFSNFQYILSQFSNVHNEDNIINPTIVY